MNSEIDAVFFDFHSTLIDNGTPHDWLSRVHPSHLSPALSTSLLKDLHSIWDQARLLDPAAERDLDSATHRSVFGQVLKAYDAALVQELYEKMTDNWVAYEDSKMVLRELKARGKTVVIVSNVGFDIRPVLQREGLMEHVDHVVLSCEVKCVKPHARIFDLALQAATVDPARVLFVGDSPHDDVGGVHHGIRTLILPRTSGPAHGLHVVLKLVGEERGMWAD